MRHKAIAHAVLAALALAPTVALAISNDEVNRALQFNFSNPGARSLALGGAFTGLADDATASYANPAGLTILRKAEFGLEARGTDFETSYASGGEVVNNPFDPSGVGEASSSDSVSQLSFASFVYPAERATFSLYYHRVGDFQTRTRSDAIEVVNANGNQIEQIVTANAKLNYVVENIGAAVGFKVSDTFSVGATLAYSDFSISSRTNRGEGEQATIQRQIGNDDDIVFSLGALWQINSQWNFGLAYRSGGDFEYTASNDFGDGITVNTDFAVPNVFSAGLAFRPTDAWLFSLDINQIEYSRLAEDVDSIFQGVVTELEVDDGTEIRFGAEYALLELSTPMFLRAGVWLDPDHRLAFGGANPSNCVIEFDSCVDATLFTEGDDETHFSVGLGWAFTRFQLDLAADFSDIVDTYSVSGVMRF